MKRSITSAIAIAVLLLTVTAESRAEDIEVKGLITGVGEVVDPGPDLIINPALHLVARPWHVAYELTEGSFAPEILVSSTFILNIQTGEGKLFGEVEWADPENAGSGFRGPFSGEVSGAFAPGLGGFDGYWSLEGYGIYQGLSARIHNYGPFNDDQIYEGVIRVP